MTTTKATAAPKCRICHKEHWLREGCKPSSFLTDEPVPTFNPLSAEDSQIVEVLERLRALERVAGSQGSAIDRLEAQLEELRQELANVTQPVTPKVTDVMRPVMGVTPVTKSGNKVTSSPERLAYLREYAKKRRAKA